VPQDSHSGYFSIKIRTYGCKGPTAKNEGMDELPESALGLPSPIQQSKSVICSIVTVDRWP
jgi:hypothetical protein